MQNESEMFKLQGISNIYCYLAKQLGPRPCPPIEKCFPCAGGRPHRRVKGPIVRVPLVQVAPVVLLIRILRGGGGGCQPVEGGSNGGPTSEAATAGGRRRPQGVEAEGARHEDPNDEDEGEGDDKTEYGEGHVRQALGENCKKIVKIREREKEMSSVLVHEVDEGGLLQSLSHHQRAAF